MNQLQYYYKLSLQNFINHNQWNKMEIYVFEMFSIYEPSFN